jgi:hypothetical protein
MKTGFATIWDGLAYRQVSHAEAEKLEKEDKCQNLSGKMHSATELKFRKDFTGYLTREVRAKVIPPSVTTIPPAKVVGAPVTLDDWAKYRKKAAKLLGKPYNKTTKAETIAYMEKHLGFENT